MYFESILSNLQNTKYFKKSILNTFQNTYSTKCFKYKYKILVKYLG